MNPVIRAIFIVMLMRAAEHFVDYLNHRLRARHGFVYELAILVDGELTPDRCPILR